MLARLQLGAPGVYRHPEAEPKALGGVRMDVAAFVGVAPRGPVREPVVDDTWRYDRPCVEPGRPRRRSVAVAVESFDEYRRLYGGFEGPGRLPFAVASFFEQGGRRAYVVRVVHDYPDPGDDAAGVARGTLEGALPQLGTLELVARSEGFWGNRLRAALGVELEPLFFLAASTSELALAPDEPLEAGSALRCALPGGDVALRFVADMRSVPRPGSPGEVLRATLDAPLPAPPETVEIVTATLAIDDGDGRRERHAGLGLSPAHPRYLGTVLCYESELVYPDASWVEGDVVPEDALDMPREPVLPAPEAAQFSGGEDRYPDLVPEDFFDPSWVLGDPEPGSGVHALTHLRDLSTVVVPDLYSPEPLAPVGDVLDPPPLSGATFEPCLEPPAPGEQATPQGELTGLFLDPTLAGDLAQIEALQLKLVTLAETLAAFVVLLDVPPNLAPRQVLRWRSVFGSSYAAAYHPWLEVARSDDGRDALVRLNPSAAAAGIIARQELAFGVPHGPANVLAAATVGVAEAVAPARHAELHPQGINVYLRERDGVRLVAGRTLARDPRYRQLSVRRLILMLRRVLEQETHWMVFEPNGPALRAEVRQLLRAYLRQLYRAGAFTGATEDEAFFVRCDDELNPPRVTDVGQLIVEVGVAPAEPIEFIVLRLVRGGDGTLTVAEA